MPPPPQKRRGAPLVYLNGPLPQSGKSQNFRAVVRFVIQSPHSSQFLFIH